MGAIYVTDLSSTFSGAAEFWSIMAGSNNPIKLHYVSLRSALLASGNHTWRLFRISGAGVGGFAQSEEPLDEKLQAATASVRLRDTTDSTDFARFWEKKWEHAGGEFYHEYTPAMRPVAKAGQGFALRVSTTLLVKVSCILCWEEL